MNASAPRKRGSGIPTCVGLSLAMMVLACNVGAGQSVLAGKSMGTRAPLTASLSAQMTNIEASGIKVGVLFEDFSGRVLYAHRPDRPLVLASNTKLFTTASALLSLPPDFAWSTTAYLDGVVGSSLWIVGAGDATFHIHDGYSYPDKFLDEVASVLRWMNVTRVAELVVDGRYFDDEHQHRLWPKDQLRKTYAASISGLPYAHGVILMKRGRRKFYAATFSPLHSVAKFMQHGLRRRGIDVGPARFAEGDEAPPDATAVIYRHVSPFSLADIIEETNLNSNNYYAEHLLKTLGAEFEGEGSFDAGVRVVRRSLSLLDVPLFGYHQLDGSGLARSDDGGNVASPRTVVALLEAMAQHPRGAPFVASLAVGGISGTLEHRFEEAPLRGRVFAKTGRIQGSLALSGYLALNEVPAVAFSILANHEAEGTYALRQQVYEFHDAVLRNMWSHLNEADHDWTAPPTIVKALSAPMNAFPPVE